MRSILNTTLSLGVLNAPVKLFSASSSSDVKFELCGPKGEDVEQVYRIKGTDEILGSRDACNRRFNNHLVPQDKIKSIEDESVVEDGVNLKETLAIQGFIPIKDIPFERVSGRYYIGPGKGSTQAFDTIVKAMEKKKVAAISKCVIRGRQSCLVMYLKDGILNAVKVSFASDEVEATAEVSEFDGSTKAHIDMATKIIDSFTVDADKLNEIEDTMVPKKIDLIEAVQSGKEIEISDVSGSEEKPDIMEAMEETIKQIEKEKVA